MVATQIHQEAEDEQEGLGFGSAPQSFFRFERVQYILWQAKVKGADTAQTGVRPDLPKKLPADALN